MRLPRTTLSVLIASTCLAGLSSPAHAFNPNEGAEPARASSYQPTRRATLPASIVPTRYYNPVNRITSPVPQAVVTAPAPAPQIIAPPPPVAQIAAAPVAEPVVIRPLAPRQIPAEQFVAERPLQPVYTPRPANIYAASAPASQGYLASAYNDEATYQANRFSFGVEAFYDRYEEPDTFPDLGENAYYGAVDFGYEHYFNPRYFAGFEQRVSYGRDNYKSSSGSIKDIPQWEFETRLLTGGNIIVEKDRRVKAYTGLMAHYYLDQSKGEVTSLGLGAYERRIFQIYLPIGFTYEFKAYGLDFAPNVEIAPMLYGNVETRLQNLGYEELNNRQNAGINLRGEFMMGQLNEQGQGWQFGPFMRYWNVPDSETDQNGSISGIEPKNVRLQVGAKLKAMF